MFIVGRAYLGKKARMKIVRKIKVFLGLVSKGICVEVVA
jgi:hypothetical protein